MPYCQPMNVYHHDRDIGARPSCITYCQTCRAWHHNHYRCPAENGHPFRYLSEDASGPPHRRDATGAWVIAYFPGYVPATPPPDTEESPEREDLPYAEELDLSELWQTSPLSRRSMDSEFRAYLRTLVSDPDEIEDLGFCGNCRHPAWSDEMTIAGTGERVCELCLDDYGECSCCEERFPDNSLNSTLTESIVCDRCLNNHYTYCDYCEGYYPDDNSYEHDHDHDQGSGCCESPQLEFTVRNDGSEPLANDTRVAFTLPAGVISPAGLSAIRDYLYSAGHYDLTYGLDVLGDQWQNRQGNYAKRLSRYAHQTHQAKLTPEIMSQVGCIARDHSKPADIEIEVTRQFNQSAEYFYHDDSCYWGSYYESRCALKTNGAYGLRSFKDGEVSGRAWVMPLRSVDQVPLSGDPRQISASLALTFDTMGADAFVVFNGYGDLGGYAPARIVAHMAGWTYRKIGFACDPMYINAGGYLVAPEHIAEPYTDGSLRLSVSQHSNLYESERVNA